MTVDQLRKINSNFIEKKVLVCTLCFTKEQIGEKEAKTERQKTPETP